MREVLKCKHWLPEFSEYLIWLKNLNTLRLGYSFLRIQSRARLSVSVGAETLGGWVCLCQVGASEETLSGLLRGLNVLSWSYNIEIRTGFLSDTIIFEFPSLVSEIILLIIILRKLSCRIVIGTTPDHENWQWLRRWEHGVSWAVNWVVWDIGNTRPRSDGRWWIF